MRNSRGISLMEILVVLVILALLVALLLPVVSESRRRSRESVCMNNLRQLGMAIQLYRNDHEQHYPPTIRPILPYVKSQEVFRCPLDTYGGVDKLYTIQLGFPVSYRGIIAKLHAASDPRNQSDMAVFGRLIAERDPNHGILICFLHGEPFTPAPGTPSEVDFKGRVLRLRVDTSIQVANVGIVCYERDGYITSERPDWHLFTDVRPCPPEVCPEPEVPCPF